MFEIHSVGSHNADLLARIEPDVFDNTIEPDQLQAFLNDARHILLVAIDDGTVVGMVSAVEYFHPDKRPQLWINEVGVAATHRRHGIGRALMDTVLAEGRSRGCVSAWLATDTDNTAAQACFSTVAGVEGPNPSLLFDWDLQDS